MSSDRPQISSEQRCTLLRFVREVAQQELEAQADAATTRPCASARPSGAAERPQVPGRYGGAFVTLRRGSRLRGCVGRFETTTDIAARLAEVTCSSLHDSRFVSHQVTLDELGDICIELSLLTDPVCTDDPLSLVPGVHGIIVRLGDRTGCFLPKVAIDRGWSAEALLSNCCTMKAGLPAAAWRSPEADVLLFTAEVFSEGTDD